MLQSPPHDPRFAYSFPPEYGIAAPSLKPFTGRLPSTDDDDTTSDAQALRTANRILKTIGPLVEEAKKKEDDLRANPYAVAAKELEDRLEKEREKVRTASRTPISPITTNLLADKMDMDVDIKDETRSDQGGMVAPLPKKNEGGARNDEKMDVDVDAEGDEDPDADGEYEVDDISLSQPIPDSRTTNSTFLYSGHEAQDSGITNGKSDTVLGTANHTGSKPESVSNPAELLNSAATVTAPFPRGSPSSAQSPDSKATAPCSFPTLSAAHWNGKHPPWYLQEFDPKGLVLHEERWLGRDIARESSPLSELSEDEMLGLVGEVGDENHVGHARLPTSLPVVPAENGTGNSGVGMQGNALTRDILESNSVTRAESSSRGRSRPYRGRVRRGRFRGRGRGRGVGSRGGSRAAEIEVDDDAEDFQKAENMDDGTLIDEQTGTETIAPLKNTSSSTQTKLKPEPAAMNSGESISAELDRIPQVDDDGNDEMDIDTPQLPLLLTQQSLQDAPQTPRTSSLSPLTSVVADFDSSPLSNPPTRLLQRDQSPSRYRGTSAGSLDTGTAEDDNEDEEGSIQNHSNPNTPQRRSRKNMVFARQSNGRFGSNKGGTVVASSSVKKKRSKRWI